MSFVVPADWDRLELGDHLFACCLLQHLLPLNIVSSSGVRVTYNAEDFAGGDTGFGFSANFAFHNEETCGGNRRISSPIGNIKIALIVRIFHS